MQLPLAQARLLLLAHILQPHVSVVVGVTAMMLHHECPVNIWPHRGTLCKNTVASCLYSASCN
jgi:hypothetical protein